MVIRAVPRAGQAGSLQSAIGPRFLADRKAARIFIKIIHFPPEILQDFSNPENES